MVIVSGEFLATEMTMPYQFLKQRKSHCLKPVARGNLWFVQYQNKIECMKCARSLMQVQLPLVTCSKLVEGKFKMYDVLFVLLFHMAIGSVLCMGRSQHCVCIFARCKKKASYFLKLLDCEFWEPAHFQLTATVIGTSLQQTLRSHVIFSASFAVSLEASFCFMGGKNATFLQCAGLQRMTSSLP